MSVLFRFHYILKGFNLDEDFLKDLILGGFHLMGYSERDIMLIITELKRLGVKRFGPSHCSGGLAIELFKKEKGFFSSGCGARIRVH